MWVLGESLLVAFLLIAVFPCGFVCGTVRCVCSLEWDRSRYPLLSMWGRCCPPALSTLARSLSAPSPAPERHRFWGLCPYSLPPLSVSCGLTARWSPPSCLRSQTTPPILSLGHHNTEFHTSENEVGFSILYVTVFSVCTSRAIYLLLAFLSGYSWNLSTSAIPCWPRPLTTMS